MLKTFTGAFVGAALAASMAQHAFTAPTACSGRSVSMAARSRAPGEDGDCIKWKSDTDSHRFANSPQIQGLGERAHCEV